MAGPNTSGENLGSPKPMSTVESRPNNQTRISSIRTIRSTGRGAVPMSSLENPGGIRGFTRKIAGLFKSNPKVEPETKIHAAGDPKQFTTIGEEQIGRRQFLKGTIKVAAVGAAVGAGAVGIDYLLKTEIKTSDQEEAGKKLRDHTTKRFKYVVLLNNKDIIENGGLNYRRTPHAPTTEGVESNWAGQLQPGDQIEGIYWEGKKDTNDAYLKNEGWVAFEKKGKPYFVRANYLREIPEGQ